MRLPHGVEAMETKNLSGGKRICLLPVCMNSGIFGLRAAILGAKAEG